MHSPREQTSSTVLLLVIVLEKRSNFVAKLIFQNELLKSGPPAAFVHNPKCSNLCNPMRLGQIVDFNVRLVYPRVY